MLITTFIVAVSIFVSGSGELSAAPAGRAVGPDVAAAASAGGLTRTLFGLGETDVVTGPGVSTLQSAPPKVTIPGLAPRNRFADAVHLILGLATVVAGGLTGVLNPETAGYNLHHALGWTSAGLAAGALASGLWAHAGDVGPRMGFSAANVHALLGIVGGLMMIAAPITAPAGRGGGEDEGGIHAALGIGGELLMGAAIAWPIVFRHGPAPAQ